VVAKQLCKALESGRKADTIEAYQPVICRHYPELPAFNVIVPRHGLSLHPWKEWEKPKRVPFWWTAHNKVKHERDTKFDRATLKNVLNAVGALLILLVHLYRDRATTGQLNPGPQTLRLADVHLHGVYLGNIDGGVSYLIPAPKS
jgi:hypothetical protein